MFSKFLMILVICGVALLHSSCPDSILEVLSSTLLTHTILSTEVHIAGQLIFNYRSSSPFYKIISCVMVWYLESY